VSHKDTDQASDEGTGDTSAGFRADIRGELDASAAAAAEAEVSGVEGLSNGSALLVVKRGPNAGARFLLDQPVTSAGRHPGSDLFLDDVTVSRRHAEFRRENGEFLVVDKGSLNGTYVNRKPVQSAVLASGDEIHTCRTRLPRKRPSPAADHPQRPAVGIAAGLRLLHVRRRLGNALTPNGVANPLTPSAARAVRSLFSRRPATMFCNVPWARPVAASKLVILSSYL
jgi:FHA domain